MSVTLYPFQTADVGRIAKQRAGLIASEMGTGKTHQAIELDKLWQQQLYTEYRRHFPTLVIAPINTFSSWIEKYAMQEPNVTITVIDRKNRKELLDALRFNRTDVFLIHWEALRLMIDDLRKYQFGVVIADEAHRASNRKAQVTRALKGLRTHRKLALSGTASGDRPENLWSILNWLWPTFYTSYWRFRNHYCVEEIDYSSNAAYRKIVGTKNIAQLHEQMSPWFARHLKRDRCCDEHPEGVMSWLPEKTYDTIWVDLSPTQRKFYEQMRKSMVAWVGEHENSPLVASIVVAQLTRLSQMALATPEIDEETGKVTLHAPSSKINAVKELIQDHDDKKFLVYCSSKQACYVAELEFKIAGIKCAVLSGDTKDAERRTMVERFQKGEFQVLIAVIQAAAEGIDGLQHATDTAIFLDRSWSTIKNQQAEDRLHRGGQKNAVTIIDVMARNTLDWGRKQRLVTKWEWIKTILGDYNT